jgi:TonB family protein
VKFVFERALMKDPLTDGTVIVRFIIDARGSVTSARVVASTLHNRGIEEGLIAAFSRWEFPKPVGGGSVVVTYPFQFLKGLW